MQDIGLLLPISADTYDLEANLKGAEQAFKSISGTARRSNDDLQKAVDKSTKAVDKEEKAAKRLKRQFASVEKRLDSSTRALHKHEKEMKTIEKAYAAGMVKQKQYNKLLALSKERLESAGKGHKRYRTSIMSTGTAMKALIGSYVAFQAVSLVKSIVAEGKAFEQLKARLLTVEGSQGKANATFAKMLEFAIQTPFELDKVVSAYTTLRAVGIEPTDKMMTSFGNTAATWGRDITDFASAVVKATTGEMESIKAFGAVARVQGKKVEFTFQGVTTVVERETSAIVGYLENLGNTAFAGGMANQMNTLEGQLSNLRDAWSKAAAAAAEGGLNDSVKDLVAQLTELAGRADFVDALTNLGSGVASVTGFFAQAVAMMGRFHIGLKGVLGGLEALSLKELNDQVKQLDSQIAKLEKRKGLTSTGEPNAHARKILGIEKERKKLLAQINEQKEVAFQIQRSIALATSEESLHLVDVRKARDDIAAAMERIQNQAASHGRMFESEKQNILGKQAAIKGLDEEILALERDITGATGATGDEVDSVTRSIEERKKALQAEKKIIEDRLSAARQGAKDTGLVTRMKIEAIKESQEAYDLLVRAIAHGINVQDGFSAAEKKQTAELLKQEKKLKDLVAQNKALAVAQRERIETGLPTGGAEGFVVDLDTSGSLFDNADFDDMGKELDDLSAAGGEKFTESIAAGLAGIAASMIRGDDFGWGEAIGTVFGAAIGAYIGGAAGAQIGGALGGQLGGTFDSEPNYGQNTGHGFGGGFGSDLEQQSTAMRETARRYEQMFQDLLATLNGVRSDILPLVSITVQESGDVLLKMMIPFEESIEQMFGSVDDAYDFVTRKMLEYANLGDLTPDQTAVVGSGRTLNEVQSLLTELQNLKDEGLLPTTLELRRTGDQFLVLNERLIALGGTGNDALDGFLARIDRLGDDLLGVEQTEQERRVQQFREYEEEYTSLMEEMLQRILGAGFRGLATANGKDDAFTDPDFDVDAFDSMVGQTDEFAQALQRLRTAISGDNVGIEERIALVSQMIDVWRSANPTSDARKAIIELTRLKEALQGLSDRQISQEDFEAAGRRRGGGRGRGRKEERNRLIEQLAGLSEVTPPGLPGQIQSVAEQVQAMAARILELKGPVVDTSQAIYVQLQSVRDAIQSVVGQNVDIGDGQFGLSAIGGQIQAIRDRYEEWDQANQDHFELTGEWIVTQGELVDSQKAELAKLKGVINDVFSEFMPQFEIINRWERLEQAYQDMITYAEELQLTEQERLERMRAAEEGMKLDLFERLARATNNEEELARLAEIRHQMEAVQFRLEIELMKEKIKLTEQELALLGQLLDDFENLDPTAGFGGGGNVIPFNPGSGGGGATGSNQTWWDMVALVQALEDSVLNPLDDWEQALLDAQRPVDDMIDQLTAWAEAMGLPISYVQELIDQVEGLRPELIEQYWDAALDPIRQFLDNMGLSNLSPLTPEQQMGQAQSQFDDLIQRALAGDGSALDQIPAAAQALLQAAGQNFGTSTAAYQQIWAMVQMLLQQVTGDGQLSQGGGGGTYGGGAGGLADSIGGGGNILPFAPSPQINFSTGGIETGQGLMLDELSQIRQHLSRIDLNQASLTSTARRGAYGVTTRRRESA